MKRKTYLPPETTVFGVEIESAICSGSVIKPETEETLTIEKQDFNKDWNTGADYSEVQGWTPNSSSN